MLLNFHVTCSCTFHAYVLLIFSFYGLRLCFCSAFSLSLSNRTSLWHPNRENPFRLRTLFKVSGHPFHLFLLFHLTFSSMMRRPRRTSLRTSRNVMFIQNTRTFCQTFLTLRYPMSFRLEVGNLYVRNPCVILSCLYRSSTLTYKASIPLCLSSLRDSKVHV